MITKQLIDYGSFISRYYPCPFRGRCYTVAWTSWPVGDTLGRTDTGMHWRPCRELCFSVLVYILKFVYIALLWELFFKIMVWLMFTLNCFFFIVLSTFRWSSNLGGINGGLSHRKYFLLSLWFCSLQTRTGADPHGSGFWERCVLLQCVLIIDFFNWV